ncbi:MAG: 3-hydroxyacyl-CoA dehydrogenase/enoyl-CoA hydratase family protein, partial [Flavobacteriales bacterium]|nr:3-hydroxyacyl-CoA dehydrogenase/enoyl-CoA hydratase family protein [Flavobacteriales bacterium]
RPNWPRSRRIPERFIGPALLLPCGEEPLAEIIPERTSPEVFDAVRAFLRPLGKDAITCKDANGFVVNRHRPWPTRARACWRKAPTSPPSTPCACVLYRFRIGMGPLALMNATGVPISYHAQRTLEVFGPCTP